MFKANKLINNSKGLYSMLYKSLIIGKKTFRQNYFGQNNSRKRGASINILKISL